VNGHIEASTVDPTLLLGLEPTANPASAVMEIQTLNGRALPRHATNFQSERVVEAADIVHRGAFNRGNGSSGGVTRSLTLRSPAWNQAAQGRLHPTNLGLGKIT
jgi:hypothetical protein